MRPSRPTAIRCSRCRTSSARRISARPQLSLGKPCCAPACWASPRPTGPSRDDIRLIDHVVSVESCSPHHGETSMSQAPNDFVQRAQAQFANAVREHSTMFLVEGIVLVVLGILAILVPNIASLAVEILIGWLMLIGGAVGLYMTFSTKGAPGYWWSLISAVIGIIAGVLLLIW